MHMYKAEVHMQTSSKTIKTSLEFLFSFLNWQLVPIMLSSKYLQDPTLSVDQMLGAFIEQLTPAVLP